MNLSNVLGIVVLIVIVFLAFRIGAFLMKGLLGLLAIAVVIWLLVSLFGGGRVDVAMADAATSAVVMSAVARPRTLSI